jgi:hypothetical protein
LILLFKGLVVFISVTVTYKGFSISTKLKPEPVIKKTLV